MPAQKRSETSALERLRGLAFNRFKSCHETVSAFHNLKPVIDIHEHADAIWNIYDWLLCPFSLWPLDFVGLANHVVTQLGSKEGLDAEFVLLLQILEAPPSQLTQQEIGTYEKTVQEGRYDTLIKQPGKFKEQESKLQQDEKLIGFWEELKSRFPTKKFEVNSRRVIRRSLSQERNFRPHLHFAWAQEEDKFTQLFDALCYRWFLYGFEGDKPLLLKITVNPTPHGTMIVIPRHWSFDKSRDLDWVAISKLHRAHGAARQGPKLSNSRIEKRNEVVLAKRYDADAKKLGLRGEKRWEFICSKMKKDPRTDPSWLKRLLKK